MMKDVSVTSLWGDVCVPITDKLHSDIFPGGHRGLESGWWRLLGGGALKPAKGEGTIVKGIDEWMNPSIHTHPVLGRFSLSATLSATVSTAS